MGMDTNEKTGLQSTSPTWKYFPSYQQRERLDDPRLPLIRHIQWQKLPGETTAFTVPEPHNYNRACFLDSPRECPGVKNQVIYYWSKYQGWITLCYVHGEELYNYGQWISNLAPRALWYMRKSAELRTPRTFLWNKGTVSDRDLSENERLWTLDHFSGLRGKYNGDYKIIVDRYIGNPRPQVQRIIEELQGIDNDTGRNNKSTE